VKFVHFIPQNNGYLIPKPVLSKSLIPKWYKEAELDTPDGAGGLKRCIPFLDGMMMGFMLVTPCDIHVKIRKDGLVDIDWAADVETAPIMERPATSGHTMPRPAGHATNHLVWTPTWGFKAPKGYSILVTHPLNRFDLPFTTMSAVVDSDKFFGAGNIPFFIKSGFEGVIPAGTPIMQLIPVKRNPWMAVFDPALKDLIHEQGHTVRAEEHGVYKKKFLQKKRYEMEN
jgi:hypothetical protein